MSSGLDYELGYLKGAHLANTRYKSEWQQQGHDEGYDEAGDALDDEIQTAEAHG